MNEARAKVLQVNNLSIGFFTDRGGIRAVQEVSFTVRDRGVWGLVGESASGKSVIGQALMGIAATAKVTLDEM